MEIETDKTTVGVPAPVSGVIEEIFVQDGDTVKAGQELFKIKPGAVSGKPAAAAPKEEPKPAAAAPPKVVVPEPTVVAVPPRAAPAAPAAPATPPPPPPKPIAPTSSIPVAAIRHAQAVEASVKVVCLIQQFTMNLRYISVLFLYFSASASRLFTRNHWHTYRTTCQDESNAFEDFTTIEGSSKYECHVDDIQ